MNMEVNCSKCGSPMTLHQPDEHTEYAPVGRCPKCQSVIYARFDLMAGKVILRGAIPVTKEFASIMNDNMIENAVTFLTATGQALNMSGRGILRATIDVTPDGIVTTAELKDGRAVKATSKPAAFPKIEWREGAQ